MIRERAATSPSTTVIARAEFGGIEGEGGHQDVVDVLADIRIDDNLYPAGLAGVLVRQVSRNEEQKKSAKNQTRSARQRLTVLPIQASLSRL